MSKVEDRFEMIFTDNQMGRIKVDGEEFLSVDMHGLSTDKAEKFLNNIINILREPACINVIHGYHGGTAIRDMIRTDFDNRKIRNMSTCSYNPGITFLDVA